MESFMNKVVVITGAGQGIGKAIAIAYAGSGAKIVLIDKNESGLKALEKQLRAWKTETLSIPLDLIDSEAIVTAFKLIKKTFGEVNILINNAGLGKPASPYKLTMDDWDYVLNTNLRGSFVCSKEAAKLMKEKGGSIVMISSTRALMSEPDTEAYAASKGGLLALTHALAISLGPDNITVNSISPGWIETGDYAKLKKKDHDQHPSGRVGEPDDIARACLFLTNPDNNFITGTNLVVDGGMTRKMIYVE